MYETFVGNFKHEILSHGMYLYIVFFVELLPREIFLFLPIAADLMRMRRTVLPDF